MKTGGARLADDPAGLARRTPSAILFVAALALGLCVGGAWGQPPESRAEDRSPAPSLIEVPLEIDLAPLFRKVESTMPRQVGNWRNWRREHGLDTRYLAWRGPLSLSVRDGLLVMQVHVRYQVQVRKRLLGRIDLDVGCGVDEPPRQALVSLLTRLNWGPDWTLRPSFRIPPVRFLDRCEVTAAAIDVTPVIGRVLRRRMEESLRSAMADLEPALEDARRQAAGLWDALQRPVEPVPGLWLTLNPFAVALAPPGGNGSRLRTTLGLALLPRIGTAGPPPQVLPGLPPLATFLLSGRGMHFDLALALDLEQVDERLSSLLAGQSVTVEGRRLSISRVELRGAGRDLVLTAWLSGEAAGRVEIRAVPTFDADAQAMRLRELDFVYDPRDPELALTVNLFYQRIQGLLETSANALLDEQVARLREGLLRGLSGALPAGVELDFRSLRVEDLEFEIGEAVLWLRGRASGGVAVTTDKARRGTGPSPVAVPISRTGS